MLSLILPRALLASLFMIFLLGSCDIIDEPYVSSGSTACIDAVPIFTPRQNPVRKVLIEEFTGHRCGNCPRGAEKIDQLTLQYPGQIVALAYHSENSGSFTATLGSGVKFRYDFRTEIAKTIDEQYGVSTAGIPRGLINRRAVSGNKTLTPSAWDSEVAAALGSPIDIDIQLKCIYDPAAGTLCSFVFVDFRNNLSGNFNLVVFLTEGDFINWQKDYLATPEDIEFYNHRHFIREKLTPTLGTSLTSGAVSAGGTFLKGYSIPFDATRWNPEKCHVVAFVYESTQDVIIQAEEAKVKP
jgi:hypothetical protein